MVVADTVVEADAVVEADGDADAVVEADGDAEAEADGDVDAVVEADVDGDAELVDDAEGDVVPVALVAVVVCAAAMLNAMPETSAALAIAVSRRADLTRTLNVLTPLDEVGRGFLSRS